MGRLLVVFAISASLTVLASARPGAAAAPTLRPVSLAPLSVRGSGFQPRERVRVTLTTRALVRRTTLTAGAAGSFTYRAGLLVAVDPCRGTIVVTALGLGSGRRASWKHECRPPDVWPTFVSGRTAFRLRVLPAGPAQPWRTRPATVATITSPAAVSTIVPPGGRSA
jgi:hypothetical protein